MRVSLLWFRKHSILAVYALDAPSLGSQFLILVVPCYLILTLGTISTVRPGAMSEPALETSHPQSARGTENLSGKVALIGQ